jgi:hypothetical protein
MSLKSEYFLIRISTYIHTLLNGLVFWSGLSIHFFTQVQQ